MQMVVDVEAVELVAFQSLAVLVWTSGICLPLFLAAQVGAVHSVVLCLVLTALAMGRFVLHARVRRVEFAPVFAIARACVLAMPTHAAHGVVLAVAFAPHDSVHATFLLAWAFSTAHLARHHHQLKFANNGGEHRALRMAHLLPEFALPTLLGQNLGLIVLMLWTPALCALATALCVSELVAYVVCTETRANRQVDFSTAATTGSSSSSSSALLPSLAYCERSTVLECFQTMPLLSASAATASTATWFAGLFDSPQSMWAEKRQQVEFGLAATRVGSDDTNNTNAVLIKLSQARFDLASQAVYFKEAQREGTVFAERDSRTTTQQPLLLLGVREANRLRALQFAARAASAQLLTDGERAQCVETCLAVLDAQALKLQAYVRVLSQQPPRNAETGLDESASYGPQVESAKDAAWLLHNAKWTGRAWLRRVWRQDLLWELDPVYEENVRRLRPVAPPAQPQAAASSSSWWLERDVAGALLDEFELCVQASKTLAAAALVNKKAGGGEAQLARFTMQRLAEACEDAERVAGVKDTPNVLYALSFCLNRDQQQLVK